MIFTHIDTPSYDLNRLQEGDVRYYVTPENNKYPSITTVTSFKNRKIFADWRKRVGNEEANRKTQRSTRRGTDTHLLIEHYLKNEDLPKVGPLPSFLFKQAKPILNNINNIHLLEGSLYSDELCLAGQVDCIAEYNGELAVIDFKTAEKEKPEKWIEHYFVQCMAYGMMYFERTNIPIKKVVIIMTCEDGDVVVYEKYDKIRYMKLLKDYVEEYVTFHNGK
jgi:genome maintenance exonuclease 1